MAFLDGVLPGSVSHYNSPSSLAQSLFHHLVSAGDFRCDGNYRLNRDKFNNFLIMHVCSGRGSLEFRGRNYVLEAGNTVLVNCYEPHGYGTREGWRILWMHFDGQSSPGIFELLHQRTGCLMPSDCGAMASGTILRFLRSMSGGKQLSEPRISVMIHALLASLLEASSTLSAGSPLYTSAPVAQALAYIEQGHTGPITLAEMAARSNMSQYHLSRLFKRETGHSPYDYVIKARVDHAKRLLTTTPLPVKEIAGLAGFGNESSFVAVFRKRTGLTPAAFRKEHQGVCRMEGYESG